MQRRPGSRGPGVQGEQGWRLPSGAAARPGRASHHPCCTNDLPQPGLAGPSQVDQWLEFALRQDGRVAPHACGSPAAQAGGAAAGYRLVLSHLECLPLFQANDRNFDVRLGVTLFDDVAGCFFGPTAHSGTVSFDIKKSKG